MRKQGFGFARALGLACGLLGCSPDGNVAQGSLAARAFAAGHRPIVARLASWSEYAPFGQPDARNQAVFRGALREAQELQRGGTPEDLHTLASLELVSGRVESAVLRYEELARQLPDNAVILSELAAGYLALAEEGPRPDPMFRARALAMADRAAAADPRLPAARFNLALALEGLHLWPEALEAWRRYASLDRSSGWGQEAQARIGDLEKKLQPKPWKQDRNRLDRAALAGDAAAVRKIVALYPQESRIYVEETVLSQWAEAERDRRPEEAGRQLTIARALGAALADLHGDRMVRDAVAAIDKADGGRWMDLVQGHLAYGQALAAYEPLGLDRAKPLLRSARRLLKRGGSPFAAWADLHLAICDWYNSQWDRGLAALKVIGQEAERQGHLALLGRVYWMEGITYLQKSLPTEDLIALRKSLAIFERLGELENVACLHERMAVCLSYLGETEESWRHLDRALSLRRELTTPRRFYSIFYTAQDLSLHLQEPSVAVYFFTQVVEAARQWNSAPALAEALWSRSRVRRVLGRPDEALADLREAERYLPSIQDASLKRRIQGDILWGTAEARLGSDLPGAISALTRALEVYRNESYPDHLLSIYLQRGRAFLQTGEDDRAEEDFTTAISLYESWRRQVEEPDFRISFFDQAAATFNQMILFQVSRRERPLLALDYVERARARVLLETVHGSREGDPGLPKPLSAESIAERIPEGVALVEYAVLPDRLLIWVIRREGIDVVSQDLGANRLTGYVERLKTEIRARKKQDREAARDLFRLLVQPALEKAPEASQLVFIPDKAIHELPFAALLNPATGRYLVEEKAVALAPSATVYLLAREHDRERARPDDKVLVVGNPAFDKTVFSGLLNLPSAEKEARTIAGMHPGAHLLTGPQATKKAVLAMAPEAGILHFAVHALENQDAPSRSRIVLAPEPGNPESGSLFASDLGSLRLPRTRLVVLSACQTAKGRISKTEGAQSLARAFLAAGVPAVVASLWPVNDRATSALLTGFHARLRQGLDPVRALQETQKDLIHSSEGDLRDPLSWASFELIGGTSSESHTTQLE